MGLGAKGQGVDEKLKGGGLKIGRRYLKVDSVCVCVWG